MEYLSEYLGMKDELDDEGTFDCLLDLDSNYFINIKCLRDTKEEVFKESYSKINIFFEKIGMLLRESNNERDRMYKTAIEIFPKGEVNGIGLGYAKGKYGGGLGKKAVKKIIEDAKEIIDAGTNEPEIFHLVGLFEENVGPDRLSDMIAVLIKEDIEKYTLTINKKLGINKERYPNIEFDNEFLINPYKKSRLLYLPKDILHELPIAEEWEDIDRVCEEIGIIRREINKIVGENWKKIKSADKKNFILNYIMKDSDNIEIVLKEYRNSNIEKYDFKKDKLGEYIAPKKLKEILKEISLYKEDIEKKCSIDIVQEICNSFKGLVENNKLYDVLYTDDGKPRKEKIAQLLFLGVAEAYCRSNNLDVNPEVNSGRGPVDFKFSNGYDDRVLVEIKLTTNSQLIHGFNKQIEEYAKAEKTDKLIYLVIDNGGKEKGIEKLKAMAKENQSIKLILVDAKPKLSASRFN